MTLRQTVSILFLSSWFLALSGAGSPPSAGRHGGRPAGKSPFSWLTRAGCEMDPNGSGRIGQGGSSLDPSGGGTGGSGGPGGDPSHGG